MTGTTSRPSSRRSPAAIPPKDCSALWALSTKRRCCRGLRDGDFGELEPRIAQAALQARETLAKTNDPQMVDIIIDRAV